MYDFFYGPMVPEINYSILLYSICVFMYACICVYMYICYSPHSVFKTFGDCERLRNYQLENCGAISPRGSRHGPVSQAKKLYKS